MHDGAGSRRGELAWHALLATWSLVFGRLQPAAREQAQSWQADGICAPCPRPSAILFPVERSRRGATEPLLGQPPLASTRCSISQPSTCARPPARFSAGHTADGVHPEPEAWEEVLGSLVPFMAELLQR